jgi:hypothetical protein
LLKAKRRAQEATMMFEPTTNIISRIECCRRQETQAHTLLELEGWQAEEEGLRDALINGDHTNQYQQGPLCVYGRYVFGLQDGEALIRAAAMEQYYGVSPATAAGDFLASCDLARADLDN